VKVFKLILFTIFLAIAFQCNGQTVYTTKTGEKYHESNCHYLKYSKKEIPLQEAIKLGYDPCSVCKPHFKEKTNSSTKTYANTLQSSSKSVKKVTATRCTGKTKSGSRCKRKTKNANGRCYQH